MDFDSLKICIKAQHNHWSSLVCKKLLKCKIMRSILLLSLLIASTTALNINCRFAFFSRGWFFGEEVIYVFENSYTCFSMNLELSENGTVSSVNGSHGGEYDNSNVEGVFFGFRNNLEDKVFLISIQT
jgi:hypothetical protein